MLVAVLLPRDKLQLDTSWAKKEAGKFTIDDHNKRDYYDAMVELENTKLSQSYATLRLRKNGLLHLL